MYIKESEIRKLIRKKLIQEAELNEAGPGSAGTATKDILGGVAAGVGTGAAGLAGYGTIAGLAGYGAPVALAGAIGSVGGSAGGAALAGGALASSAGGAALAGAGQALGVLAGPPGWIALGVVALGVATAGYFLASHADGGEVSKKALDASLYQEYKKTCLEISKNFKEQGNAQLAAKWKTQPELISNQEAQAFAKRLYNATKGSGIDIMSGKGLFGMGTDEEEIQKVLNEIPTILDVSFVSDVFQKKYEKEWFMDSHLLNVFNEELDASDYGEYVEAPLADKMDVAFIDIFGTKMTQDEWGQYQEASVKVAKEVEKAVAGAEDAADEAALGEEGEGQEAKDRVEIYTTSDTDPWEYKVSEDTGCWLTRKKADAPLGAFKSLGNNARATRILDEKFPDARTEDQKDNCPATGGGSRGGNRAGGISRKGAQERARRATQQLAPKNVSDIRVNITGPLSDNKNIEEFKSEFQQVIVDTLPASKKIPSEYSIKINTGPRGRVQYFRSNWDGIDEKGLSAQVRKMITGRRKTRGTIDVTIPAGDYSTLNEGVELKALIKRLSRKV